MPKQKVTETESAYIVEHGPDTAAIIASAMAQAGSQITSAFIRRGAKKDSMKEVWAMSRADEQKRLYESWDEREKKFYGLKPRADTPEELADKKIKGEQAKQAELGTSILTTQRDDTLLDYAKKQAIEAAKKDPDPYVKYYIGHQLQGEAADRMILKDLGFGEEVNEAVKLKYQFGDKFVAQRTSAWFEDLQKTTGEVNKFTFPLASAMAKAEATGDLSEVQKIFAQDGFPKAMRTMAEKNLLAENRRIDQNYAQMNRSYNQAIGSASASLLSEFSGLIGPQVAQATAKSFMDNKPLPDWVKPYYEKATGILGAIKAQALQKASFELATAVNEEQRQDIAVVKEGAATLSLLGERGDADSEKKSELLGKELNTRIRNYLRIPEGTASTEQGWGSWAAQVADQTGKMVIGAGQTGIAVAGDVIANVGSPVIKSSATPGAPEATPQMKQAWEVEAKQIIQEIATPTANVDPKKRTEAIQRLRALRKLLED